MRKGSAAKPLAKLQPMQRDKEFRFRREAITSALQSMLVSGYETRDSECSLADDPANATSGFALGLIVRIKLLEPLPNDLLHFFGTLVTVAGSIGGALGLWSWQ